MGERLHRGEMFRVIPEVDFQAYDLGSVLQRLAD